MPAYIIAEIEVTDAAAYEDYKHAVAESLEDYGGHYIVRGGEAELLEGEAPPARLVVIAFPDMLRLRAWYESETYAEVRRIRQASAKSRVIAVEGT